MCINFFFLFSVQKNRIKSKIITNPRGNVENCILVTKYSGSSFVKSIRKYLKWKYITDNLTLDLGYASAIKIIQTIR